MHSLQFLCRYIGMITKYDCQHSGKLACNQNTLKGNDLDLILFVCNISGFPLFLYTTIFLNIAAAYFVAYWGKSVSTIKTLIIIFKMVKC